MTLSTPLSRSLLNPAMLQLRQVGRIRPRLGTTWRFLADLSALT